MFFFAKKKKQQKNGEFKRPFAHTQNGSQFDFSRMRTSGPVNRFSHIALNADDLPSVGAKMVKPINNRTT